MAASTFSNTPVDFFYQSTNGRVGHNGNGGRCVVQKKFDASAELVMEKGKGSLVMASCTLQKN